MRSKMYYESHVTIEPVEGERLKQFKTICLRYRFHVARLIMEKGKLNDRDAFCTSRDPEYEDIETRTLSLVKDLQDSKYTVKRYKIEDTLLDSKIEDVFQLLNR